MIVTERRVVCDNCGEACEVQALESEDASEVARREGFLVTEALSLCPVCAEARARIKEFEMAVPGTSLSVHNVTDVVYGELHSLTDDDGSVLGYAQDIKLRTERGVVGLTIYPTDELAAKWRAEREAR